MKSRTAILSALALCAPLTGLCRAQAPVVTLDPGQPTYEVGQALNVTISTDPGFFVSFLADMVPGPTTIPGIGTLNLGFSPALWNLSYVNPPSGSFTADCLILCDSSMFGLRLYSQAIAWDPTTLTPGISNPATIEFVAGDCTDDCNGGVLRLGLQARLSLSGGGSGPSAFCADPHAKIAVLRVMYTGEGCGASSHSQDPSKVTCSGDPLFEPLVRIRASDKANPTDPRALVWFDGTVALGGEFDIDASAAGETRIKNETYLHVYSPGGTLLQTVGFHTSCSQPLNRNDQFGSIKLLDYTPENSGQGGTHLPGHLVIEYRDRDFSHSVLADFSAPLDPNNLPALPLVNATGSIEVVHLELIGNELVVRFEVDGRFIPGLRDGKLKANSFFYLAYDQVDVSQQIHTSCSQPIAVGMVFGPFIVTLLEDRR